MRLFYYKNYTFKTIPEFCNILYNIEMRYNFVKFGTTANTVFDERREDYLFFERYKDNFTEIFDFLSDTGSCYVLSGFQGIGKSKIIDEALSFINDDVLLFKYQMHEATTLDDILLNLTLDFREYHKNNKAVLPKIDTKDFRERIQYYVKNIDKPMLLVLESYENVLKFEDTAPEINDFLLHLASLSKFKIIFVSRFFDSSIFEQRGLEYSKTILSSLDEESIGEYLRRYRISAPQDAVNKLVSGSRCYLMYIDMTIRILQTFNISLEDLMAEFTLKKTTFSNFLINKFIGLIPERSRELVYTLVIIREAVSKEFLNLVGKNNENSISYLKKIYVLSEDKNNVYIKDYFKKELEKEIEQFDTIKIHAFLETFYDNMLPKKPFERELMISRNTMRREKEFHGKFVENYQHSGMRGDSNLSGTGVNMPRSSSFVETTVVKEPSPESEEISFVPDIILPRLDPHVSQEFKMVDYLVLAEKYEKDFDYSTAIFYYQKALEKNTEKAFDKKRPDILAKTARCYLKTNNREKALQYLDLTYELYFEQKQLAKANEILLEIAQEHKNSYRLHLAKSSIEKILNSADDVENSPKTLAAAYSILADIEDLSSNVSEAKNLYKNALDNALKTNDLPLISAAYFKYGLLLDDTNRQSDAIECYKKCVETSSDIGVNAYLSSAYSNLAGIYYEREDVQKALHYYHLALEADKSAMNNEGLYFVYTKLANIYRNADKETTYKLLLNALQAAKRLNDKIYSASAYLEIGDYYYLQKAYKQAVKSYLSAKHFLSEDNDIENKAKIGTRLKDLEIKLGKVEYDSVVKGFRYNDEN